MATTKSYGTTDTPISGVTSLSFSRGLLNFAKDFRVKSNNPGKDVILTNITSPVDRPEILRISYSEIPNIYQGSGIEASVASPTKKGISVLAQISETITVTDSADPEYRVDLPVSFRLVIKVPASQHIVAADLERGIGRLLSSLYDTGSTQTNRLDAIIRGSLAPSDV